MIPTRQNTAFSSEFASLREERVKMAVANVRNFGIVAPSEPKNVKILTNG